MSSNDKRSYNKVPLLYLVVGTHNIAMVTTIQNQNTSNRNGQILPSIPFSQLLPPPTPIRQK